MGKDRFKFRQFEIIQKVSPARVGTDGILLGAWAPLREAKRILDIGTGTGLLALMLAQRKGDAKVDALEVHPEAAEEARRNVASSSFSERIRIVQGDIFDLKADLHPPYDLIISNPPYFSTDLQSQDPGRRSWRSGSQFDLAKMLTRAAKLSHEKSRICLVLPVDKGQEFAINPGALPWFLHRTVRVKSAPGKAVSRVLLEMGKEKRKVIESELLVQTGEANEYSPEYQKLTRDFYPWMD